MIDRAISRALALAVGLYGPYALPVAKRDVQIERDVGTCNARRKVRDKTIRLVKSRSGSGRSQTRSDVAELLYHQVEGY